MLKIVFDFQGKAIEQPWLPVDDSQMEYGATQATEVPWNEECMVPFNNE